MKVSKPKTNRKKIGSFIQNRRVLTIIGIAAVGFILLASTRAATPSVAIEVENGTITGSACRQSDATASNSSTLIFGKTNCSQNDNPLGLARIPWEGGPAYWKASNGARFTKADAAGWDEPSFFPITVFFGKPETSHVTKLKDAGINTFAPAEHNTSLSPVTSQGLFVIAGGEWWGNAQAKADPKVVGSFISDECEMGYGGCDDGIGSKQGDAAHQHRVDRQRSMLEDANSSFNDNSRFNMANFGNGILRTYWGGDTHMQQHVRMMDVTSADKYTYTSPPIAEIMDGGHDAPDWPNGVPIPRAYSYGWQADQMKRFQDPSRLRPVWTFVETFRPFLTESNAKNITPEQLSGAVWSAIIHEARGISYFQHNNAPSGCTATYSIVDCPAVHAAVKSINAKVTSLAPVINTQSYYNTEETINGFKFYRYRFNNGTDTMLKTYNGSAYIFAGLGMKCNNTSCTSGTVDATGSKTFTLPNGVNGTSVEVVGENRTLPVTNRQFTDSFPQEYTNHVYRITI